MKQIYINNLCASNDEIYLNKKIAFQPYLYDLKHKRDGYKGVDFTSICDLLIAKEELRVKRNELASRTLLMLKSRLGKHVLPFLGNYQISEISAQSLENFLTHLHEFNLSHMTISQYFNAVRKVLQHAISLNHLEKIPVFPKLNIDSIPRGGFTVREYLKILRYSKNNRQAEVSVKCQKTHRDTKDSIYVTTDTVPYEFSWLIGFMVNSFVRPVDIKLI